jgi:hypothetical protein
MLGVPAVLEDLMNEMLHAHERYIQESLCPNEDSVATLGEQGRIGRGTNVSSREEGCGLRLDDIYPVVGVRAVFPVAPGLVFISAEGASGPSAGAGEWRLYLWFGGPPRVVWRRLTSVA